MTPGRATVHVGAPKAGSTYLQDVLWRNRDTLRASGVLYPLQRPGEHFHATLDVREMSWGGRVDGPWLGSWERVAARLDDWSGDVVLSNELLGGARRDQASRVVDALAGQADREVHVVFTARDLARQLPSDWQEHVKHRHSVPLSTFVDDLVRLGRDAPAPFGEMFWGLHDAESVLDTWATVVPEEQIHLVTVPQGRATPHGLWERFARAAGMEGLQLDLDVDPRNVSLGVVEAETLRRLNVALRDHFPARHYDSVVRQLLAEQVLVAAARRVPPSERLTLPPEHDEWARVRSAQLIRAVAARRYDVVGDLDELLPAPRTGGRQPEQVTADDIAEVSLDGLTGTLRQLAEVGSHGGAPRELRRQVIQLENELADVRADRDYWRDGGLAHRLVRFSDQHRWLLPLRHAFVRVRDLLRRGVRDG